MLIDANIFLEVLLDQEKASSCKKILEDIRKGKTKAIITNFTIDSIIIIMNRNKTDLSSIELFIKSLLSYQGLTIYQINFKDRLNALKLIEKYNLDYEDAITLQSAISTNNKELLSFDAHFDKVEEIRRIEP
ncbi:MAG: type II toxin-antitoxin system VapC family toxin [Nanoarchaeota archaeon]